MVANSYTYNQIVGTYHNGVARPIKDKARVAGVYLELFAAAKADPAKVILVQEVTHVGKCSRGFTKKCMREIGSEELVNLRLKDLDRVRKDGVLSISDEDGMFLLALCRENNRRTFQEYCICLIEDRGVFVLFTVICK